MKQKSAAWVMHRERGSSLLLRVMTFLSLRLGRRASRIFLYCIAAYFFTFAPEARRHSIRYLRRALNREPSPRDRFRHILWFASTIHDRVFLLNDRFDTFRISVEGEELMQSFLRAGQGTFLMGAHMGSFEVMRALGRQQPGLAVVIAMYEENARKINAALKAINPQAAPEIVPLGQIHAMLKISERLDQGAFVGVLGDRTLGPEAVQGIEFLGARACFPTGPMRAASLLRRPVIFMLGLYRGSNRYHLVFEPLADFSASGAQDRERAVESALLRYAHLLEKHCRSDPYNWFNFFDFWNDDNAGSSRTR